jgi:hypothetical protein
MTKRQPDFDSSAVAKYEHKRIKLNKETPLYYNYKEEMMFSKLKNHFEFAKDKFDENLIASIGMCTFCPMKVIDAWAEEYKISNLKYIFQINLPDMEEAFETTDKFKPKASNYKSYYVIAPPLSQRNDFDSTILKVLLFYTRVQTSRYELIEKLFSRLIHNIDDSKYVNVQETLLGFVRQTFKEKIEKLEEKRKEEIECLKANDEYEDESRASKINLCEFSAKEFKKSFQIYYYFAYVLLYSLFLKVSLCSGAFLKKEMENVAKYNERAPSTNAEVFITGITRDHLENITYTEVDGSPFGNVPSFIFPKLTDLFFDLKSSLKETNPEEKKNNNFIPNIMKGLGDNWYYTPNRAGMSLLVEKLCEEEHCIFVSSPFNQVLSGMASHDHDVFLADD